MEVFVVFVVVATRHPAHVIVVSCILTADCKFKLSIYPPGLPYKQLCEAVRNLSHKLTPILSPR